LLTGLIFAFFIGASALSWVQLEGPHFEKLFLIGYGGVPLPLEIESYLRLMLSLLVPQVFLVFILADYMLIDFTICSVYIFTRTPKRNKWFIRKALELIFLTALFYLFQFIALFVIGQIAGLVVSDIFAFINLIASEFVLLVLISFIYVLAVNILSLKIGINHSFLAIVLLVSLSSVSTLELQNTSLLKFIPISQSMLIWHENKSLLLYRDLIGDYLPNFTIAFSIAYALIVILLLVFIGIKLIDNFEIVGFEKEG
jgi:hypothetical protein